MQQGEHHIDLFKRLESPPGALDAPGPLARPRGGKDGFTATRDVRKLAVDDSPGVGVVAH
jgi:hypothetical protein